MEWSGKTVLITGGSGTIGHALVPVLLNLGVDSIRIYSRDERKQEDMARKFDYESRINGGRLRFFIGDVRDLDRLRLAMKGANIVIHAAALKIVPACFYNSFEALSTNVLGTKNIILSALDTYVEKVVLLSTDKSCEATTLYGASKCLAEHLMIAANNYSGDLHPTRFCVVRYGNVVNSRGSVLPLFLDQIATGELTVTDIRSTRFWIPQSQAVALILNALEHTRGGEVFVPKAPTMKILDLAHAISTGVKLKILGLRTQEKLHEVLITYEEARRTKDGGPFYVIEPEGACWKRDSFDWPNVPSGFRYVSNGGDLWVSTEEFKRQAEACKRGIAL